MAESLISQPFQRRTFSVSQNKLLLEERVEIVAIKPRQKKVDFLNIEDQAQLLERFLTVHNLQALVKYANTFGLPCFNADCVRHQANLNKHHPQLVSLKIHVPYYYISLAATLRWLICLLNAISEQDYERLDQWIERAIDPWDVDPGEFKSVPKRVLRFRVDKRQQEFSDWQIAETILTPTYVHRKLNLDEIRFELLVKKAKLDFAKNYFSFHINHLISKVRLEASQNGQAKYKITSQFEAMCMVLFNQFTGSTGVAICRNPNCPTRFYITHKKKRKQRSDRKYCGRPGCQKWGVAKIGRIKPVNE